MRIVFCVFLSLTSFIIYAQPNCEAFKYAGEMQRYKACKVAEKRKGHYQFSKEYQQALDKALAIDSTFAFAYRIKSTAYLKSGDFIRWKQLIDQAVRYDPQGQLFYRASCRYQFFRDYQGAIQDIEQLDALIEYDIGFSQNGDYHLQVLRALCYKALGQIPKAISIIEEKLTDSTYLPGVYDYLHLGVLYWENGQPNRAIEALKQQREFNNLAENHYYLALIYQSQEQKETAQEQLKLALKKYLAEERMHDPYSDPMDKIYLSQIEEALKNLN